MWPELNPGFSHSPHKSWVIPPKQCRRMYAKKAVTVCKNETPLPPPVSLASWYRCELCTWHSTIGRGREGWLRISHTSPVMKDWAMWESLKCIHAHNVEEARGHSNGCQGLVCLSELKTIFSVSLAAGVFELYNPAGSRRWECHMRALIKCYI